MFAAARVQPGDRVLFAFSFGPFLGFWTAFEAGCQIGAHCVPGGGMTSHQRLALIDAVRPERPPVHADLRAAPGRGRRGRARPRPAHRERRADDRRRRRNGRQRRRRCAHRIERAWGARVIDHDGLTEVGPVAFEDWDCPGGLYVNEAEFIAEVLDAQGAPCRTASSASWC